LKVWTPSDSKCIESIKVHDDAVNFVVAGSDNLVFTGSADGRIKARGGATLWLGGPGPPKPKGFPKREKKNKKKNKKNN
jgi:hypothetical protein